MARLQEYKRSLDAVVTIHSAAFLSKTTDEILRQIKQEPDTEHDETIYDTCTSMKDQLEENLSNNEYGNKSSNENIVSYQTENAITSIDDRVKKNSTLSNVTTQICWNQLREKNNVDPKNGKRKRSQGRDDIKSSKRFKKDLKISKEKTGDVKCKTCFVSFKTKLALQNHLIWFKNQGSYTNKDSSSTLQKYTCNFCQCKFSKKKIVQGHLFHSHQKEIEHNSAQSISTKGALNSHYNSLIKDKMRQTTLTEFMSSGNHLKHTEMQTPSNNTDFSSQIVIKQEIDINDELSNPSTNTSLSQTSVQNEHRRESIMTNKPFVQIHVDPSMMEALLGIPYKQNDLAELLENNRNKVYNLRSLKSNKVNEKHKKNINYKLKVKNLLRMCKRCSIPLTKCDDKSIVGSTAQFSTPLTGILRQNNHSSLKQSRRYREKRNVKFVTKTSPQESSSANSTPNLSIPISASSSSSSSKVKELEKDEIKSPRKSLTNRRSLNENTVTCKKNVRGTRKKRSLEKNVENSEVLPFQDNSNLTPVQSSQPRKDFKLKDLRVSLIKLPMIKKELDTPNETVRSNEIFNCTVCEIPFSSEKKRNRHIKKYHTACISSICTARCRSKSFMLNHYLQKHIIWKWNKCCVCRQFCTSRVSLKQHLLLHCIKTVLTKNEKRPSNYIRSCVPINMTRRRKRSQLRSIQLEQISNVEQDNLTVETVKYNVDNIVSQIEEFQQPQQPQQSQQFQQPQQPQQSQQFQQPQQPQQFQQPQQPQQLQQSQQPQQLQQSQQPQQPQQSQQLQQLQQNDEEAQRILNDKQETQIAIEEMQKSLEDNTVIYLSPNYEVIPMDREPEVDPLCIINNISTPDCSRETQITLMSSPKTVRPSIDKPNVTSVISNITPNSIKQKYPCPVCRKQFQKLESLWQHKRTYTQSFQHCCTICGMCFSNRKILRNHVNTTHNRLVCNLYKLHCQFCNQGFRTQNNLQIHELHYHATTETADKQKITELLQVFNSETNDNTFQTLCNVCGLLFNNYERYQLHTMYFHTAPTFPCNYCNRVFQGLYMLHHHNKLYHYPESIKSAYKYRCPICLEGFTIETHLHGHLCHVHTEERHEATSNVDLTSSACYDSTTKRYVCTKCRQEFTTVAKLMKHVERYLDDGNYLCERCPRRCSTLALLHEHVQLSHNNILRNAYKCDMCEEVLLSSSSLYSHQKHFHYYLENSGSLEIAERTPNENVKEGEVEATTNDTTLSTEIEKPEEKLVALHEPIVVIDTSTSATIVASKCNIFCPICGVKFEKDTYLKQHLAEFLDIGDYKCNECQRRFANNELLQKHLSSHITPGMLRSKYHCSLCNENFQSAIVYESHVAHIHAQVFFKDVSTVDV